MPLIINDVIFLRRPTLNYVCPPVCEVLFSSTGFPVIVLNPVPHHGPPVARIDDGVLQWKAYPGAICFNIYKATTDDPNGPYEIIRECYPTLEIPVDPGCYRVSAITIDGESDLSNVVCFKPTPPSPPTVTTLAASGIGEDFATLNGMANPESQETDVFFEWGTDTSYGNVTPSQDIGNGGSSVAFSAFIFGLTPGTTYHFRAVATNPSGTAYGADMTFVSLVTPCQDSEVDDWAARIVANGGTVSASTLTAACQFMTAVKAAGIRSRLYRVNLFAGDQFVEAALVPIIKDLGHPIDQRVVQGGSVGPSDFTYQETGASGGVQPVTFQAYLSTGVTADAAPITITSCGLSFYDKGNATIFPNTMIGALHFNTTTQIRIGNSNPADIYGIAGSTTVIFGTSNLGLCTLSRINNDVTLYENGVSQNTNASAPALPPGDQIDMFSFGNGTGSNIQFADNRCAGYAIHGGLTDLEVADFYAAFQTFNAALSRQE